MVGITPDLAPYVPLSFREGGRAEGALLPTITEAQAAQVAQGIMERTKNLPPAAAQLYLAMVEAADLAPNGQVPANVDAALGALEQAVTLLSSLSVSSADLDFLARALLEQTAMQRHEALQQRLNAREFARIDLLTQAAEMNEQAKNMRDGAIASVVLSVVAAAVSVVGGAFSLKSSGTALKQADESLALTEKSAIIGIKSRAGKALTAEAGSLSTTSQANSAYGQGIGVITGGVSQALGSLGGMSKSLADADGKFNEAQGATAAAEAQNKAAVGDMAKEVQGALDDMIRAIITFLKELQEARSQQMQAFTRV